MRPRSVILLATVAFGATAPSTLAAQELIPASREIKMPNVLQPGNSFLCTYNSHGRFGPGGTTTVSGSDSSAYILIEVSDEGVTLYRGDSKGRTAVPITDTGNNGNYVTLSSARSAYLFRYEVLTGRFTETAARMLDYYLGSGTCEAQ